MENKINITELNREVRNIINFGSGDIIIYEPDQELIDEMISLQEQYYNENGETIPKSVIYMDVIPKLTNINLNVDDELLLQQMLEKPKLWLKWVLNEIDKVLIEANRLKSEEIKTQLKDLETFVERVENNYDIPNNVKNFFAKNKEKILQSGDEEFIESAKMLNLIDVPEENAKEKKIKELELEIKKIKDGVGV
jgi:uncharacterized protein (UPF0147 family)